MSTWLENLFRIGPLILGLWSHTAAIAPLIVAAVANAEQVLGAKHGADKKRYALEAFDRGLAAYNVIAGEYQLDPAHAHDVASVAIDMTIATVNLWSQAPDEPGVAP